MIGPFIGGAGAVRRVGIGEEQQLALRRRGALVTRPRLADPAVGQLRAVDDAEATRVPVGHGGRTLGGVVVAPIVDDDHLEVRIGRGGQ